MDKPAAETLSSFIPYALKLPKESFEEGTANALSGRERLIMFIQQQFPQSLRLEGERVVSAGH
jgi:hypothetical protein